LLQLKNWKRRQNNERNVRSWAFSRSKSSPDPYQTIHAPFISKVPSTCFAGLPLWLRLVPTRPTWKCWRLQKRFRNADSKRINLSDAQVLLDRIDP
ncbi:MAG: hypothetical protein ACKVGW_13705, partial [Verrucomicrobiia bacterium]